MPPIAGHWDARFSGVAGTPLVSQFVFNPCRGCAAIALVKDPLKARRQRVRMRRSGRLWVASYRSRSYCGYRLVIRFRPGRTRTVEGERFAVRGSGTHFSRGKGCGSSRGFRGTLRFRAKRVSELRVVGANVSGTELGDGCNPLPFSFVGESDGSDFGDNFARDDHSWRWDFGDGATSTERRPRHTFPRPGRYFVSVFVRLTDGSVGKSREPVDVSEPAEGC